MQQQAYSLVRMYSYSSFAIGEFTVLFFIFLLLLLLLFRIAWFIDSSRSPWFIIFLLSVDSGARLLTAIFHQVSNCKFMGGRVLRNYLARERLFRSTFFIMFENE